MPRVDSPSTAASFFQRMEQAAAFGSQRILVDKGKKHIWAHNKESGKKVELLTRSVKAENRKTARHVVEAIKNQFGESASRAAEDLLKEVIEEGQHLSSRHLQRVIKKVKSKVAPAKIFPEGAAKGGASPTVPYGLSVLHSKRHYIGTHHEGIRKAAGESQEPLGRFYFHQEKKKGVEPGFVGYKYFDAEDYTHLLDENHRFSHLAAAFLLAELGSETSTSYQYIQELLQQGENTAKMDIQSFQKELSNYLRPQSKPLSPEAKSLFNHLKQDLPPHSAGPQVRKRPYIGLLIQDYIQTKARKFTTPHYVKLDYKEKDMRKGIFQHAIVQIPKERAKGVLHRFFTGKTQQVANFGAVRECLANDMMHSMGIYTQKLKIVSSEYKSGAPKLLLDGTHMKGPNGESFSDFSGKIRDGYLVDDKGESDQSIEELGKYLIFFLLMGDRDAIGSRGDNKGRVGNRFAAIDPGHSFEIGGGLISENLMAFKNIHEDFSFDQPKRIGDKISKGYKNFSIFQDRPYLEKFQGVLELRQLRESGKDLEVLDAYLREFSKGKMDFSEPLKAIKAAYVARRDYILDEVFAERLAIYDKDLKVGPRAVNFVDVLEKLSSVSSQFSPSGAVVLQYPRVIKRLPWSVHFDQRTHSYLFKTHGKDAAVQSRVQDFLRLNKQDKGVTLTRDSQGISLKVPASLMGNLGLQCDLKKVSEFNTARLKQGYQK